MISSGLLTLTSAVEFFFSIYVLLALQFYSLVAYPSCTDANNELLIAGIILDVLVSTGV